MYMYKEFICFPPRPSTSVFVCAYLHTWLIIKFYAALVNDFLPVRPAVLKPHSYLTDSLFFPCPPPQRPLPSAPLTIMMCIYSATSRGVKIKSDPPKSARDRQKTCTHEPSKKKNSTTIFEALSLSLHAELSYPRIKKFYLNTTQWSFSAHGQLSSRRKSWRLTVLLQTKVWKRREKKKIRALFREVMEIDTKICDN